MNRGAVGIAGVVLLALCASAGAQPGGPVKVECVEVAQRDMSPTIELVGTVLPNRRSLVGSEIAGTVQELPVLEGDRVEAGGVLCRLRDDVRRYRWQSATGRLEQLRFALAELEAGERAEDLARWKAAHEEAEAERKRWEFERDRVTELWNRGQCAPKEYHETLQQYHAAVGRAQMAEAEWKKGRAGPRAEVIQAARAAVEAQEAEVRLLQYELERTAVKAPFAGYVTIKHTEVGQWVSEGAAVAELVEIDSVRIRVNLPEAYVRYCAQDAEVGVRVEATGGDYVARVLRVIPDANAQARTFPVDLLLSNVKAELKPGMFTRARMPAGPKQERLVVPKDAIVRGPQGMVIWVVRSAEGGDTAAPSPVQLGEEWLDSVAVSSPGLAAGDRVIVRGNESLHGPGPVIAVPWKAAAPDRSGAPKVDSPGPAPKTGDGEHGRIPMKNDDTPGLQADFACVRHGPAAHVGMLNEVVAGVRGPLHLAALNLGTRRTYDAASVALSVPARAIVFHIQSRVS
ncbi:MAG: efflux RND transporter periplasmic adaptor subunit [Phycisphaerae bacterium]|nr:efflux RND transporter periplasmic adaptor subunit [Phycisphaerae bacterium]NUQ45922.1 efflux RND transporter periplasmic adaptor subunit [Phycisphaerae bacterium]